MINDNTLKTLNEIGFGADIDMLESYLLDYKQSTYVSSLSKEDTNYSRLLSIFRELKPNSIVLSDSTDLYPMDEDKYDTMFERSSIEYKTVYGKRGLTALNSFNTNSNNSSIDKPVDIDIIGILNIVGINIAVYYLNGYLYRIYAVGNNKKYMDLTDKLKKLCSEYLVDISDTELVKFTGKLTISKSDKVNKVYDNVICSAMHIIRTNTNVDKLSIVINDVDMVKKEENIGKYYNNQWEKIEFMKWVGLNVPQVALIKNVNSLSNSLRELDEYLYSSEENKFNCSGFIVKTNNTLELNENNSFIYDTSSVSETEIFESTVKSVSSVYKTYEVTQRLNIVPVKCNNKFIVQYIDVNDIYLLEKLNIKVGKRVSFKIINGKAELLNIKGT